MEMTYFTLKFGRYVQKVFLRIIIEIGTYDAFITLNNGLNKRVEVLKRLGITIGKNKIKILKNEDGTHISSAEKRASIAMIEARKNRKRLRFQEEDKQNAVKGYSSAPCKY